MLHMSAVSNDSPVSGRKLSCLCVFFCQLDCLQFWAMNKPMNIETSCFVLFCYFSWGHPAKYRSQNRFVFIRSEFSKVTVLPAMMGHSCHPSSPEAEAGGLMHV